MVKFSKKTLIKRSLRYLTIVILCVLDFTLLVNFVLLITKNRITRNIYERSNQRIYVNGFFYVPPADFILKDVFISHASQPLSIKTSFSLKQLLTKRKISLSAISFYQPKMNYANFISFLKKNLHKIVAVIISLPREESFKLSLRRAKLSWVEHENNYSVDLVISFNLNIKNNKIEARGLINSAINDPIHKKKLLSPPLRYNLIGDLDKNLLTIENLTLSKGNLYSKLWGKIDEKSLQLYGFAFINEFLKEKKRSASSFKILEAMRLLLYRHKISPTVVGLSRDDLNIFDINCKIKLAHPLIDLEHLSFTINNLPVELTGSILNQDPLWLTLSLYARPQRKIGKTSNLHEVNLEIGGNLENDTFSGNALLNLTKERQGKISTDRAQIKFDKLALLLNQDLQPSFQLKAGSLIYNSGNDINAVTLNDLMLNLNLGDERYKFIEYNSLFYGGRLEGKGRIDAWILPLRNLFTLKIEHADASRLGDISDYFSNISGDLCSEMYYRNFPSPILNGEILIDNGRLEDQEFFNWLADFFNLPSLKKIDFEKITIQFSLTPSTQAFKSIRIYSNAVDLNGYYRLDKDGLVSSQLSLGLERGLLKNSTKFRPLLRILGKDAPDLRFDFQLSGTHKALNFQWLESDFKKRLRDSIPDFIERKIEKTVEEILEPISQK